VVYQEFHHGVALRSATQPPAFQGLFDRFSVHQKV